MNENMYPKVLFICRGSLHHGIGHITRSRAVAEVLAEVAIVKMVVIGEQYVANLLSNRNFEYLIIANENELPCYFDEFCPDIIVFDLLFLSGSVYHEITRGNVLTVSLSPIFNFLGEVDLLFHRTRYLDDSQTLPSQKYCGLPYSVISQHTKRIPENVYRHALQQATLSVAISMGGTDAPNKTLEVIKTIKKYHKSLLIWVLLGEGYTHSYDELVDCVRESKHEIILIKANNSMWRILINCALIVLTGGTTTYEAAYAGIPSINLLENFNRSYLIQELVEAGVSINIAENERDSIDRLNDAIDILNESREELLRMHLRTQNLLDSQGAKRIRDKIMIQYNKFLKRY